MSRLILVRGAFVVTVGAVLELVVDVRLAVGEGSMSKEVAAATKVEATTTTMEKR
jgi:hypothetical protein